MLKGEERLPDPRLRRRRKPFLTGPHIQRPVHWPEDLVEEIDQFLVEHRETLETLQGRVVSFSDLAREGARREFERWKRIVAKREGDP